MAAALTRRRGVLALALSSSPVAQGYGSSRRAASIPSTTARLVLRGQSTAADDPSLANGEDYGWLKESRSMRIRARPVASNNSSSPTDARASVTKVVHFLRHGQGTHNELYKQWTEETGTPLDLSEPDPAKNPMVRPDVIDARLTPKGIEQCTQRRSAARTLQGIELVVVSPLLRTLETAHIALEDHLPPNARGRDVKWIAHEGVREELGMLMCNKRRPLREVRRQFPHVDFTHLPGGDEDIVWDAYAEDNTDEEGRVRRESTEDMSHRAYDFLVDFVHKRPERELAVVGHSAWLLSMTGAVLDVEGDHADDIGSMFGQAELRSMELWFEEQS